MTESQDKAKVYWTYVHEYNLVLWEKPRMRQSEVIEVKEEEEEQESTEQGM